MTFQKQNSFMSLMYQSIPSMTIPQQDTRHIFMGEFPTPWTKRKSKLQPPDLSKQAKTPPLGHFPQLFTIKPGQNEKEIMQNCKILSPLDH